MKLVFWHGRQAGKVKVDPLNSATLELWNLDSRNMFVDIETPLSPSQTTSQRAGRARCA
jgi:hypothetical protein